MATFDFEQPDASAWPAPWSYRFGGAGDMSVVSGRGRLTKRSTAYDSGWLRYGTSATSHVLSDFEITFKVILNNIANEFVQVDFRSADAGFDNRYFLSNRADKAFELVERVAAVNTLIPNSVSAVKNYASQTIKLRAEGATLSYKVWPTGTTEPAPWDISVQRSTFASGPLDLVYNTGNVALDFADFDDIVIDDLTDTTPPAAPTGLTATVITE